MGNYRFILSGGGTGGHIYPAIAIAKELQRRYPNAEFLFVGAENRMEMEKVPQAGFKIEGLWISGIQRKITGKNLMFPIKLVNSLYRAKKIIQRFKPDVAIGTGGFASGPLLRMAEAAGVPCVLQEQNSFAGVTNKWLADRAQVICVAYDGMERYFPKEKLVKTGNPVRADLVSKEVDRQVALERFGLKPEQPVLLVLGGSLGAAKINALIAENLTFFKSQGVQLLWQCGKLYWEQYREFDGDSGVVVRPFLDAMDYAYAVADYVVSRAGAGSVSELCLVGKPVIFIPSPNVAEDHQTKNAMALVEKDAALMLPEHELQNFQGLFQELLDSPERQEQLGGNIMDMGLPGATGHIADEIEKLMK